MVPTESRNRRGLRSGRTLVTLVVWALCVNSQTAALAQEEDPSGTSAVLPAPEGSQTTSAAPTEPVGEGSAAPTTAPPPAPTASARSIMDGVRAAARQLVPLDPSQDPRLRSLDTSFPAEQPEVPEPPLEVIAPTEPRSPARRTLLRTVDGVTVLTNVTEPVELQPMTKEERASQAEALAAPATTPLQLGQREMNASVHALEPETKRRQETGFASWLWALGGFALLLLVPIGVLLTRPVRKG